MERVLIPLDGSPRAERILAHVREHLRRVDAEVLLLRVVPDPVGRAGDPRILEEANQYLDGIEGRLAGEGLQVSALVWIGAPAPTILDVARRERATLIALTTHGRTGLPRWIFGSVAEEVARSASIPVLVVRSFPSESLREPRFRRIVVPLDGTAASASVLDPAIALARRHDADVVLVHVFGGSGGDGRTLDPAADYFEREGIAAVKIFRSGSPAAEIVAVARETEADLIALSTQGRRWGSVTGELLRTSPLPMLVVRGEPAAIPPPQEEVGTAQC